ncbi:proteoglycan 4b isoform X1 [Embiotoca jacksoni]|uniref:proteoglycan 4b isoform X1 n=1 Tax=Embiotoca jacksoni TaxID=100190 RepID=UPI0037047832
MSSTVLFAVMLLACTLNCSATRSSCGGRCGGEYYRGDMCQCDYNCLSYGECCKDFESQCTTKNSCKGRCGESFKRGRLCSCDSDCINFKQCCPDFENHCDAEEKITGAASATSPMKTSPCDKVNNNKPKEPSLSDATEQSSTFSEGNVADDNPLGSQTSNPQDDFIDDIYSETLPTEEFSKNGMEDLEASPIPESNSEFGSNTGDLLGQVSTEPTLSTDTLDSTTETTPSDKDNLFTVSPTKVEAPTGSTDASDLTGSSDQGTTLPQPTTAADQDSSQPTSTSVPQTEASTPASTPERETAGQAEINPMDDIFPSDEPEITTIPPNKQESTTVLENTDVTTIPASSMLDSTTVPEETTSNVNTESSAGDATTISPSSLGDLEDPSTTVSPQGPETLSQLDAVTTPILSATAAVQDDTTDNLTPGVTTADPLNATQKPTSEPTSKPQERPEPLEPKPETKPLDPAETLNVDDTREYQADDSNDTNLCSGRPVGGVTTLSNGTIAVFRGHYFWLLGSDRVPGPAQSITQVWGVPSPIDTVFTRCNCNGKTYIFKRGLYWRFENDHLDSGYPKVIHTGFSGLRGHITAALSVPQYQRRREAVYFFKRGGYVQKYSYQFGTSAPCSRKPQYNVYTVHNRVARQAVSVLERAINIRTSWKGFPSTITAAVSVPSNREPEGYKYYVFSRSKSYNVRMDGQRPVIAAPKVTTSPETNNFFKCPKKV